LLQSAINCSYVKKENEDMKSSYVAFNLRTAGSHTTCDMAFGPGPRPKMRTQLLTPHALQSKKSCEKVYLTTAMESINVGLKDADAEACIGDPFASPEGGGKNIEDVIAGILWAFVFLLTVGCAGYGLLILFGKNYLA
jgi:hypothetical protein